MVDYKTNDFPYQCDQCGTKWNGIRAALECCEGQGYIIKTKIIKKFSLWGELRV